jgi:hypothetical protein
MSKGYGVSKASFVSLIMTRHSGNSPISVSRAQQKGKGKGSKGYGKGKGKGSKGYGKGKGKGSKGYGKGKGKGSKGYGKGKGKGKGSKGYGKGKGKGGKGVRIFWHKLFIPVFGTLLTNDSSFSHMKGMMGKGGYTDDYSSGGGGSTDDGY